MFSFLRRIVREVEGGEMSRLFGVVLVGWLAFIIEVGESGI